MTEIRTLIVTMLLLVKTNFPGYLFPVYFLIAHLHGKNTHLSVLYVHRLSPYSRKKRTEMKLFVSMYCRLLSIRVTHSNQPSSMAALSPSCRHCYSCICSFWLSYGVSKKLLNPKSGLLSNLPIWVFLSSENWKASPRLIKLKKRECPSSSRICVELFSHGPNESVTKKKNSIDPTQCLLPC